MEIEHQRGPENSSMVIGLGQVALIMVILLGSLVLSMITLLGES